jgi:hypothetical protein
MKMKKIKLITLIVITTIVTNFSYGQTLNWASLDKEQRHIINLNAGLEFGVTYGIGYGYQLKTALPIVLNIEQSHPSGKDFFEDFKTKIGGQVRIVQVGDFQFSVKIQGVFRRFENPVVQLVNFGSDVSGTFGFYNSKWFLAGEIGFDKAIVTHFKHTQSYRDNFPTVQDGWYEPATGGNFYYGIQAGYSFKRSDNYLKVGNVLVQDFKTKPFIPFYAQLGFSRKF